MRILVVDDEAAVRDSLSRTLRFEGYEVSVAEDGLAALDQIARHEPDAVILDVMMPRLDGLETCRRLRADGRLLPVLMLTARDTVGDRVAGLDAGADDYLTKPFALQELLARLRALLRRSLLVGPDTPAAAPVTGALHFADLTLDPVTREVRRAGREIRLTNACSTPSIPTWRSRCRSTTRRARRRTTRWRSLPSRSRWHSSGRS